MPPPSLRLTPSEADVATPATERNGGRSSLNTSHVRPPASIFVIWPPGQQVYDGCMSTLVQCDVWPAIRQGIRMLQQTPTAARCNVATTVRVRARNPTNVHQTEPYGRPTIQFFGRSCTRFFGMRLEGGGPVRST